jgi:hypothetical protein
MKRPSYCAECGSELTPRNDLKESSWEDYDDCIECSVRYHTSYGDMMGGAPFATVTSTKIDIAPG